MFKPEPFWMTSCWVGSSSKNKFLNFGYCSMVTSSIKNFIGECKNHKTVEAKWLGFILFISLLVAG